MFCRVGFAFGNPHDGDAAVCPPRSGLPRIYRAPRRDGISVRAAIMVSNNGSQALTTPPASASFPFHFHSSLPTCAGLRPTARAKNSVSPCRFPASAPEPSTS